MQEQQLPYKVNKTILKCKYTVMLEVDEFVSFVLMKQDNELINCIKQSLNIVETFTFTYDLEIIRNKINNI